MSEADGRMLAEAEELEERLTRAYKRARGVDGLPEPRRTVDEEREAEEARRRRIVELRALTPSAQRLERERAERARTEQQAAAAVRGVVAALVLGKRLSRDGSWGAREVEQLVRELARTFGLPEEGTGAVRAVCEGVVGALAEGDRRRADQLASELGRALVERGWSPSATEEALDPRELAAHVPRRPF